MDRRPLGYESQMAILQYMEANKRFLVTKHMPSIRTADRATPLTIESLVFKPYELEINGVNYSLRIHQQNREGHNPAQIDDANQRGTIYHDLNRYGLEDHFAEDVVYPGDLKIKQRIRRSEAWIGRARRREMFELERNILAHRRKLVRHEGDEDRCRVIQQHIKDEEDALIPYLCFSYRRPSPYDVYFQLRETDLDGNINIERFVYNKQLPEAMNYFTTKLFGNRRHPIKVGRMVIDNDDFKNFTIRLPQGLKLKVNEIRVYDSPRASILRPVLLNSHVENMYIRSCHYLDNILETLNMARSLRIDSLFHSRVDWLSIFQNLRNQELILTQSMDLDSYIPLIRYWIEHGKPAGTRYTFAFLVKDFCDDLKKQIMEQLGGLTITMRNQCKLVISFSETSYEEVYGHLQNEMDYWEDTQVWLMKMEVVE